MNIEKTADEGEGVRCARYSVQDFFEFLPVKVSQIEVYLDEEGKYQKFYATGFILS